MLYKHVLHWEAVQGQSKRVSDAKAALGIVESKLLQGLCRIWNECIVWYCLVIDHGAHTHKIPRDYSLRLSLRTPHRKIARAKISCSQSLLLVDLKLLPVGLCRFPTYINSTEDVSGWRNSENWYHHTFSFSTPLTDQSINYKLLRGIGLVALLAYKCLRSYSVPYHVIHVVPCSFPFSPASPQCRNPSLGNSAPFLLLPGPVDVGIAWTPATLGDKLMTRNMLKRSEKGDPTNRIRSPKGW